MRKEDAIEQAKQKRRRQALLDQALRDCARDVLSFHWEMKTARTKWWTDASIENTPDAMPASYADQDAAWREHVAEQTARILGLLDAGADINTPVVAFDRRRQPTHTTTMVNFLLKVQSYTFYPLVGELLRRGARPDEETAQWVGEYASAHYNAKQPSTMPPPWFTEVADRVMQVPGIRWERPIQEQSQPGGSLTYWGDEDRRPNLWLIHAIERYYPGFTARLKAAQEARGEALFCLAAATANDAGSAHEKLRGVVCSKNYIPRGDQLELIDIHLRHGADPTWKTEHESPHHTVLGRTLGRLDAQMLDRLLTANGAVEQAEFTLAARGAILKSNSPLSTETATRQLLAVVEVMMAHGAKIDLDATVRWSEMNPVLMDTVEQEGVVGEVLETKLPDFSRQFQALHESHVLQQSTPVRSGGVARRL